MYVTPKELKHDWSYAESKNVYIVQLFTVTRGRYHSQLVCGLLLLVLFLVLQLTAEKSKVIKTKSWSETNWPVKPVHCSDCLFKKKKSVIFLFSHWCYKLIFYWCFFFSICCWSSEGLHPNTSAYTNMYAKKPKQSTLNPA